MLPAVWQEFTREVMRKVQREHATTFTSPATVLSVNDVVGQQSFAVVHVDNDPPERSATIPIVGVFRIRPGMRVMILWTPPQGALVLGPYLPQDRGGDKPYATYVVSASDSIAPGHENADWVCDGVDDDVEIQAAVDAAAALNFQARVLLLEGNYYVRPGFVSVGDGPDYGGVHLEGMGYGTVLRSYPLPGNVVTCSDGGIVSHMHIAVNESSPGDQVGLLVSNGQFDHILVAPISEVGEG